MPYVFAAAGSGGGGGGGAVSATEKWSTTALTTLLSTELNSLATNTGSNLGTEFDNTTTGYFWGDFELVVTFGVAPTADTTVDLYLIPALDGTNYCDGGNSVLPVNTQRGQWSLRNVTSMRLPIHAVMLPPCKFKIFVFNNNSGQAFAGSGNTVKMLSYCQRLA
jgi:hypothetical protein